MSKLPIDPQREYKPSEIAKFGFIVNTEGKPDYRYILRLIESNKLKARNAIRSSSRAKYYKVLGADIIAWKNSTVNIVEQPEEYERAPRERRPHPQPA